MTIIFELLKVRKFTCLKIYKSLVTEKTEHQIWTAGKPHSNGSIGHPFSGVSDVIDL